MSWSMPVHRAQRYDERDSRNGGADGQNARTARTVAEHATDVEDCRLLLDMLGLRLDVLRADGRPPSERAGGVSRAEVPNKETDAGQRPRLERPAPA